MPCPLHREIYSPRPTSDKCLSTLIRVPARQALPSAIRNKPALASGSLLVVNICPAVIEDISPHTNLFFDRTRAPYPSQNWRFTAVRNKRKNVMISAYYDAWHMPAICTPIVATKLANGTLSKMQEQSICTCLLRGKICDGWGCFTADKLLPDTGNWFYVK
jgi:hypothetical protein